MKQRRWHLPTAQENACLLSGGPPILMFTGSSLAPVYLLLILLPSLLLLPPLLLLLPLLLFPIYPLGLPLV